MFYLISKAVWRLAEPGNVLLLAALAGAALSLAGGRRLGRALLWAALAIMTTIAIVSLGGMALSVLEARFPQWRDNGPVDGIIVLGGGLNASSYFAHHGSGLNGGVARIFEAARLASKYKSARLVYSGGPPPVEGAERSEGRAALQIFAALGIGPERVALELNSRNTYENALFVKRLVQPKPGERWLVVTSAFHMPRAIACFRAVDFPVAAFPVDFKYLGHSELGVGLAEGLTDLDLAVHEWTGLFAYRLLGKTKEVLPAP